MRDLMFRGKTIRDGRWVISDSINQENGTVELYDEVKDILVEVDPETVGQFTGLTDKNGVNIFEGDIIKQEFSLKREEREVLSVIEYGVEYAYSNVYGVCQRFRDGSGKALLSVFDKSGTVLCEIIGNKYDNRELL